jgi:Protein of unknown function (DUF3309)
MEVLGVMVAFLVATVVALPEWSYSAGWGYFPAGACGIVALLTAALIVVGRF